jgi:hypothetical protein
MHHRRWNRNADTTFVVDVGTFVKSACGHTEPRTWDSEARCQRQFALGVGPQRQCKTGPRTPHQRRAGSDPGDTDHRSLPRRWPRPLAVARLCNGPLHGWPIRSLQSEAVMPWLREGWRRVASLRTRHEVESRLDEEIRFHIDWRTDRNMRAGLSPEDARRQALIAFGGQERIKDNTRDEFRTVVLEDALRDLSHSARALRRAPGFTIVASVTLALGIGATTALFSVVNGLLIKPLPYPDADALVAVWHTAPGMNTPQLPLSASQYVTLAAAIWRRSVRRGTVDDRERPAANDHRCHAGWIPVPGGAPRFEPSASRGFDRAVSVRSPHVGSERLCLLGGSHGSSPG